MKKLVLRPHQEATMDSLRHGFSQGHPFSKSFSAHVQQLGRIMRPHDDKDAAIWLDHSGNYLRFRDQWDDLCSDGVSHLHDGAEKTKPEPSTEEKEAAKCPKCGGLWTSSSEVCSHCGFVHARKNDIVSIAGNMTELSLVPKTAKYSPEFMDDFYAQLIGHAQEKRHNPGVAYHHYFKKFKAEPPALRPAAKAPTPEVLSWIKSRQIAFAKMRKAA